MAIEVTDRPAQPVADAIRVSVPERGFRQDVRAASIVWRRELIRFKSDRLREFVELVVIAIRTSWLYLFLGRRVAAFERLIDDFAERSEPQRLAALSLRDLRLLLNELMNIRGHRWTNASLADAAAMVCYAMLRHQVEQVSDSKASGTLHNTLLKWIPLDRNISRVCVVQ